MINNTKMTKQKDISGVFIKFLYRGSVGFFSRALLVFLMKESKKRRRKLPPGKLMAKSRSQPVNLPGARPLMNPLTYKFFSYFVMFCGMPKTST